MRRSALDDEVARQMRADYIRLTEALTGAVELSVEAQTNALVLLTTLGAALADKAALRHLIRLRQRVLREAEARKVKPA